MPGTSKRLLCRQLVLAAFDRRPEWQVSVHTTDSDAATIQDDSLFYWGEYESIDWEQVHAGEPTSPDKLHSSLLPIHHSDSELTLVSQLGDAYAAQANSMLAATASAKA